MSSLSLKTDLTISLLIMNLTLEHQKNSLVISFAICIVGYMCLIKLLWERMIGLLRCIWLSLDMLCSVLRQSGSMSSSNFQVKLTLVTIKFYLIMYPKSATHLGIRKLEWCVLERKSCLSCLKLSHLSTSSIMREPKREELNLEGLKPFILKSIRWIVILRMRILN